MALQDYALQGETKEDKIVQYTKLDDHCLENMRRSAIEDANWAPYKVQALEYVIDVRSQDERSKFHVTFNG